jgi:phosphoribosylpyrophosphate synthetase
MMPKLGTNDLVVYTFNKTEVENGILKVLCELGYPGLKFGRLNMERFPDNEPDLRVEDWEKLTGKVAIIIHTVRKSQSRDQLLELSWALKHQYGVKYIIAVLPFMMYRRQDHPEFKNEVHRNLYFVHNMKANGIDGLVVCDIHSDQTLINCHDVGIKAWNVDPTPAFSEPVKKWLLIAKAAGRKIVVYTPDFGSIDRSVLLAREMNLNLIAINAKKRLKGDEIEAGKEELDKLQKFQEKYPDMKMSYADKDLSGATIIMREDEVSTGGTANKTGWRLRNEFNVDEVFFFATHPVCTPGWKRKMVDENPFKHIYFGNTLSRPYPKTTGGKVTEVKMQQVIGVTLFQALEEISQSF